MTGLETAQEIIDDFPGALCQTVKLGHLIVHARLALGQFSPQPLDLATSLIQHRQELLNGRFGCRQLDGP